MSPLLLHGNTNQYNINGLLCTYTEKFRIQTCCNYILSAAEGFRGQEATCADPGIFVSHIKASAYFTFHRGGPMVLLLRKLYLYFTKDPEGVHYFPRGGQTFSRGGGVQTLISLETHVCICYFPGGCPDPLSPSGSAHGQCHHNGTIFITVLLLTIIVRN